MAEFTIEIAGQAVGVRSLFASTKDYCARYWTSREPEFFVEVHPEDLEQEQQRLRQEAIEEGFRFRTFPDPFLDRAVIQRKIAEVLFVRDILLFHGSAIAVDGRGYLFTAKSGTGKSTHTRLWRQVLGDRAVMVNDDKPFLRFTEGGVLVCGAPWSGKHGLDANVTVPLGGICILERGQENRIWPIGPEEARPMLEHQSCPPSQEEKLGRFRELVDELAKRVPLWRMECTKEPEAAVVAFEAMEG